MTPPPYCLPMTALSSVTMSATWSVRPTDLAAQAASAARAPPTEPQLPAPRFWSRWVRGRENPF